MTQEQLSDILDIDQYWCNCGAGAVGLHEEHDIISDWVGNHQKECKQGEDTSGEPDMNFAHRCDFKDCTTAVFGQTQDDLDAAITLHAESHLGAKA